MLIVNTPADDPWLLTIEETKAAAGVTDNTQDAAMESLRATVSAQIYDACNVIVGNGGFPPTLRREVLTEKLLAQGSDPIILSRRHEVTVTSVTGWSGGTGADTYFVDEERGMISPINGRSVWGSSNGVVTIVYEAGFIDVPPVLKAAAVEMIKVISAASARDPLVKKTVVDIDGVERLETEFWVTAAGNTAQTQPVPPIILATLKRFTNSILR